MFATVLLVALVGASATSAVSAKRSTFFAKAWTLKNWSLSTQTSTVSTQTSSGSGGTSSGSGGTSSGSGGTSSGSTQTSTVSTQTSTPDCEPPSTYQAFSSFGDSGEYYLAPQGDFEGSLSWSRSGSVTTVTETDPFNITRAGDIASLRLPKDARVTTPKLCVTSAIPHLRFVAKAARGAGQLDVEVRLYGADGSVTDSSSGSVSPSEHAAWSPSRYVALKTDSLAAGETGYVDIVFRSQGDWLIDDVLIDPYRRR